MSHGPWFKVSSDRQLIIVRLTNPGTKEPNPQPGVFKSSALTTELCGLVTLLNLKYCERNVILCKRGVCHSNTSLLSIILIISCT